MSYTAAAICDTAHTQAVAGRTIFPMDAANPRSQTRTLREAALLLGGERKLAEFLDMAVWLVSRWLEGLGQPPDSVFKRCAELIESSKEAATAADERDKGIVVRQVL